jgi:hypothetical protein
MKQLTFNVQIQAEFFDQKRIGTKKAAHLLCQDINVILAKYNGSTGSAHIVHGPRNIKLTNDKAPGGRASKDARRPGRRCRSCHRPERIRSICGLRLSNISPHLGLCAQCIKTSMKL